MASTLGKYELISVVIPVLNESASLEELGKALLAVGERQGLQLEIIFVDDGSSDGSWDKIHGLAGCDLDELIAGNDRIDLRARSSAGGIDGDRPLRRADIDDEPMGRRVRPAGAIEVVLQGIV